MIQEYNQWIRRWGGGGSVEPPNLSLAFSVHFSKTCNKKHQNAIYHIFVDGKPMPSKTNVE